MDLILRIQRILKELIDGKILVNFKRNILHQH